MSDKHFCSCALTDLPELGGWISSPHTREMLVQNPDQGEQSLADFVGKAVPLVAEDLPTGYTRSKQPSPGLARLKQQGYSNAMIAETFAYSWLAGADRLYLPRLKSNLANNAWVQHVPPIVLTIIVAIKLIYIALAVYGSEMVTYIYASPGFVLIPAIPVYLLMRHLWLKCVPRFFKSGGVRNPNAVHPLTDEARGALKTLQQARANNLSTPLTTFATPEFLPMFQRFEMVSSESHSALYCADTYDYRFAEKTTFLTVSPQEVGRLVHHYPLIFSNQGSLELMALMGLAGKNRYCSEQGEWQVAVKPERLQHYPFALAATEDSGADATEEKRVLVLDPDAPQLNRYETGEALFDVSQQHTPWLQQKQAELVAWNRQCLQARPLLHELESHDVLTTAPLTLEAGDETKTLNGLRRVDLEKVKSLDDATLARWARNGLLQVAYLQLASLEHLDSLLDDV